MGVASVPFALLVNILQVGPPPRSAYHVHWEPPQTLKGRKCARLSLVIPALEGFPVPCVQRGHSVREESLWTALHAHGEALLAEREPLQMTSVMLGISTISALQEQAGSSSWKLTSALS